MGMAAAAADLVNALRAAEVLEAGQLAEAARLQTFFADAKTLAGDLIQRGWLTPFQANLLLQGRGQDLCLGAYVLLERLGEGGMGTVYKARQRSLGRIVAVKVIRKDRVVNPQAVKRFQREIRAAAQLDHPNIVRAFDADEIAGTLLLVMEYVDNGTDLAQIVKRDGPLPIATACDYMRQAALGLQHAHERGLVHRDIKPQNLLVVRGPLSVVKNHGPRTTDHGQIKILDMGLARLDHPDDAGKSSTSLTGEGTVMGTVDYIAPEQALDSHHVDIRADLYSLGCTFYYLLTGRVPFPGGDAVGKLIRQQTEEPEPFEMLRPEISPALAAIVRKLMAKRKEDRFQTPAELAVALEEAVKHGVESRSQGSAVRSQKSKSASVSAMAVDPKLARQWAEVVTPSSATEALVKPPAQFTSGSVPRRARRWLAAGGAAAMVLLILLVWQPWRRGGDEPTADSSPVTKRKPKPPSAEELAEQADKKRQAEAEEALKPIAARMAPLGAGASAAGEALRKDLREFLIKHSATPAATKACDLLGQVLANLPSPLDKLDAAKLPEDAKAAWKATGFDGKDVVAVLGEHWGRHWVPVRCVSYSPAEHLIASSGDDGTIRLWRVQTMSERTILKGHTGVVRGVAFSRDGKRLASASDDGTVTVWDAAARRELLKLKGHTGAVISVAFSPDGKRIASASHDETVRLWETETGLELRTLKAKVPNCVVFSPDGTRLASGQVNEGTVILWDVADGGEVFKQKVDQHHVWSVAFSPDGQRLALACNDGTVKVIDAAGKRELFTLKHGHHVYSVAFSYDGKRIASASYERSVKVWNASDGALLVTLKGHESPVNAVAFSPDGKRVVSGGDDGTVRLWDVDAGKEVQPLKGHVGPINSVAFANDDSHLVSGGADAIIRVWDPAKPVLVRELKGHTSQVNCVAFSPDVQLALSGGRDSTIRLWNVQAAKEEWSFTHGDGVDSVAFSPDGRSVLMGGQMGRAPDNPAITIRLFDVSTGKLVRSFQDHQSHVNCVVFSPDGQLAASASADATVRLWHAVSGQELRRYAGLHATKLAFAPDGRKLFLTTASGWLMVCDLGSSADHEAKNLKLAIHKSSPIALTPDGKMLATTLANQVLLCDALTGNKLREWQLPGPVHGVVFAADGRHLATANTNGTVYIFRLAPRPPDPVEAEKTWNELQARFKDAKTDRDKLRDDVLRFRRRHYGLPQTVKAAELLTRLPSPLDKLDPAKIPAYELEVARRTAGASPTLQALVAILGDSRLKHWEAVRCVAFSPDGKTLASGSFDGTVKLWDPATGSELRTLKGHTNWVWSVAFSPDGKTLASGCTDGTVKLWDPAAGSELRTLKGHAGHAFSVAFSSDGKTLASGSYDFTIKLWDPATGIELRTLKGHTNQVYSVAFSPDGNTLASGSLDQTVKLWDLAKGSELRTLKGHTSSVHSVVFSPDGKTLASGGNDSTVRLWNAGTGNELRTLTGLYCVAFSPDGKTLASANGGIVTLWDRAAGSELRTLKGHTGHVTSHVYSVAFSPDGKTLASASGDGSVKLWDPATGSQLITPKGHTSLWSVAFSPDSKTLASASADGTAKLWDPTVGSELHTLKGPISANLRCVAFSPDGNTLASASDDANGTLKLWDPPTGSELRTLKGHTSSVISVAFSPDGTTLASASHDGTAKLWDVAAGTELRTLRGHTNHVYAVAFSPDGKTLASGGNDGTVRLWNAGTGEALRTLTGHSSLSVAFSPDGKTLASGNYDNSNVTLWDPAAGSELRTLKGHTNHVWSVAFSPDGKTLASAASDGTVRLWDPLSGTQKQVSPVGPILGHVRQVALAADGRHLATANGNGTVYIFRLPPPAKALPAEEAKK